jgi:hypothetical protein
MSTSVECARLLIGLKVRLPHSLSRDAVHPLARRAVQFADGEAVALDVPDHARREQLGRGIDHAADDALRRDLRADHAVRIDALHRRAFERSAVLVKIPIRDPVLHRHDHGLGAEEPGHLVRHRFDLVRLHRQDDDVLSARPVVAVGGLHLARHLLLAVGRDQLEAVGGDGVEVGSAHDERDLLAGQRELRSDQAADRAGPDDCYLHVDP